MPRIDFDELSRQTASYFQGLQVRICHALEEFEHREHRGAGTARFSEDSWQHHHGGGGITRVLIDGKIFEKAGVNFSHVTGSFSEELAATMRGTGTAFSAMGISLVIHPRNPHVPTVHANFRHISKGAGKGRAAWFGGGSDLTPYYPRREDVIHFHRTWKEVCERHPIANYTVQEVVRRIFYLPHRREARGVGGIFFEYLCLAICYLAMHRYKTPSISGHTVNGSRHRAGHQTQKNMKTIEEGSESRLSSTAPGIWNAEGHISEMRSGGIDAS